MEKLKSFYVPLISSIKGLWRRLDIRLSSILFAIIFAWFGTFLLSLHWVQKERLRRSVEIERERIQAKIESEMRVILGSLVLNHEEALDLTLKGLVQDLGLHSIELALKTGRSLRFDGGPSPRDGEPLNAEFPVREAGRDFGVLRVQKGIALLPYASGPIAYWIAALIAIQGLLFWIIRRFLRSQVIDPIRQLVSSSVSHGLNDVIPTTRTEEIEELNKLFLNLRQENETYHQQLIETEKRAVLGKIASQVSHDIRSPLAALEVLLPSITKLPEQERVLARLAINRIRDIAYLLLAKGKENEGTGLAPMSGLSVEWLPSLIEAIVTEKRVRYQAKVDIEIESRIESSAYGAFARINAKDFQRTLSNLVDNAVEAMPGKGRIEVSVACRAPGQVEVIVTDNGNGIPADVLEKLQTGIQVTHGKLDGHGLGFAVVREKTREWGADLAVQSTVGAGTEIKIILRLAEAPGWFLSTLDVTEIKRVAILDDDPSIHQVWNKRLADAGVELHHFSDPDGLRAWCGADGSLTASTLFLLDYEFIGSKITGIDVAMEMAIANRAVLVTSRFDESRIQEKCESAGIKLVPKPLAAHLSIQSCKKADSAVDFVLIDDDELIHLSWDLTAQRTGTRLMCHPSEESFQSAASEIPKDTPIYIDVNLAENVRGETVAKSLFEQGYKNLYLATGEMSEKLGDVPWVRAIVGKTPPFTDSSAGG